MSNYIRFLVTVIVCFLVTVPSPAQPWKTHGRLVVLDDNPHYISHKDDTPFLWFGDTAWELMHRLNREEVLTYMQDRKNQGFNLIQTVAISEFHDRVPANYYGDSLFSNNDRLIPKVTEGNDARDHVAYDYWDHLEYVVGQAQQLALYVGLLPTWGEWVIPRGKKSLFNSPNDAYDYGWFLSNRLKAYPNIIWILGGDRHPDERDQGVELWRAMAEGIADATNGVRRPDGKAEYSTTFMTHHSYQSSSKWFHGDQWIDFHMWGSYHSDYYLARSYEQTASDRALKKAKPTINGEPCYEDHPVNYAINSNGVFSEIDVRNAAYWTLFSGAAGYTYGAHPIWQFTDSLRPKYSDLTFRTWREALQLPGASNVLHLKRLMESRPMKNLYPDQSMIVKGQGTGADYVCAIKGEHHALIYVPTGADIAVKAGVISGKALNAFWYDPRTGVSKSIGTYPNAGTIIFKVPGISESVPWLKSGRGCDWVLVLDDASKNFRQPGQP